MKNVVGIINVVARQILDSRCFPTVEVEVILEDERLTTVIATNNLIFGDVSRKKRKQVVDKMAAVEILQGYLDKIRR